MTGTFLSYVMSARGRETPAKGSVSSIPRCTHRAPPGSPNCTGDSSVLLTGILSTDLYLPTLPPHPESPNGPWKAGAGRSCWPGLSFPLPGSLRLLTFGSAHPDCTERCWVWLLLRWWGGNHKHRWCSGVGGVQESPAYDTETSVPAWRL